MVDTSLFPTSSELQQAGREIRQRAMAAVIKQLGEREVYPQKAVEEIIGGRRNRCQLVAYRHPNDVFARELKPGEKRVEIELSREAIAVYKRDLISGPRLIVEG